MLVEADRGKLLDQCGGVGASGDQFDSGQPPPDSTQRSKINLDDAFNPGAQDLDNDIRHTEIIGEVG
jgi:hypothetical protein